MPFRDGVTPQPAIEPLDILAQMMFHGVTTHYIDKNEDRLKVANDMIAHEQFINGQPSFADKGELVGAGRPHTHLLMIVNPEKFTEIELREARMGPGMIGGRTPVIMTLEIEDI